MSVEGSKNIGQQIKDIWKVQVLPRLSKRTPKEVIVIRPEDSLNDLMAEEEAQVLREPDHTDVTKVPTKT
jgi:hypothetical protein